MKSTALLFICFPSSLWISLAPLYPPFRLPFFPLPRLSLHLFSSAPCCLSSSFSAATLPVPLCLRNQLRETMIATRASLLIKQNDARDEDTSAKRRVKRASLQSRFCEHPLDFTRCSLRCRAAREIAKVQFRTIAFNSQRGRSHGWEEFRRERVPPAVTANYGRSARSLEKSWHLRVRAYFTG